MAASITLPPQVLQATYWAVRERIMNKRPDVMDRSDMPWFNFLNKRKTEDVFLRGQLIQKLKRSGGLDMEFPARKGQRHFQEPFIDSEMYWTPTEAHMGITITHKDLMDRGYVVPPNGDRSRSSFRKLSKAQGDTLIDYVEELFEEVEDNYDREIDKNYLLDGTHTTNAPAGLDALLPLDNTSGTIGGQNRSDPLFQHHVITGSTVTAGGTLQEDLNALFRAASNKTRGMKGKIDMIMVGDDWLDAYATYAKNNGIQINTDSGTPTMVDIAIPDEGRKYNRLQIVRNPTFEDLDSAGLYTGTPWAKRAYLLNSKSWQFVWQGFDKYISWPDDPHDLRETFISWDGYYSLLCRAPNQNAVNTIA